MKQFTHSCIALTEREAWRDALDGLDHAFA